jgi:heat shock protein HtpX
MNTLKTFLLMGALTVLLVLVGNILGGQTGMVIAFGFAVLMNFGSYWFSDRIVLKMYRGSRILPDRGRTQRTRRDSDAETVRDRE